MGEKAKVFFMLLNELYKLDAQEKLSLIGVIAVPYMSKEDSSDLITRYRMQSGEMLEALEEYNDYSAIDLLKKEL